MLKEYPDLLMPIVRAEAIARAQGGDFEDLKKIVARSRI